MVCLKTNAVKAYSNFDKDLFLFPDGLLRKNFLLFMAQISLINDGTIRTDI